MQATVPKQLDFYIYDAIFRGYKFNWATGEIKESETSADYFKKALAGAEDIEKINLYINSIGGSIFEAISICNQLKRHKAHVTVYVDGFAASAASVIAMAGDEIIMPKNTVMMIHNPIFSEVTGNAKELRKMADDLDKIAIMAVESYLAKAGDKLQKEALLKMLDEETYLTAEQCVEYGLADKYTDEDADMDKALEMLKSSEEGAKQAEEIIRKLSAKKPPEQVQTPPPAKPQGNGDLQSTAEPEQKPEDKPEPKAFDVDGLVRNF